jgi:hypothetical protein
MRAYFDDELSLLAQDVPSQKKMLRIFKVTDEPVQTYELKDDGAALTAGNMNIPM